MIEIHDDFEISYIPLVKRKETIRLAEGDEAEQIINSFSQRSKEILAEGFVNHKYSLFAADMLPTYLMRISSYKPGIFLRICNRLSGHHLIPFLLRQKYVKFKRLTMYGIKRIYARKNGILF